MSFDDQVREKIRQQLHARKAELHLEHQEIQDARRREQDTRRDERERGMRVLKQFGIVDALRSIERQWYTAYGPAPGETWYKVLGAWIGLGSAPSYDETFRSVGMKIQAGKVERTRTYQEAVPGGSTEMSTRSIEPKRSLDVAYNCVTGELGVAGLLKPSVEWTKAEIQSRLLSIV